jgi:TolB-like protein
MLVAELKRRNVFKIATAYIVVGWVVLQVAEFFFESFGAPSWAIRSLTVLVVLGFPIAAILAWAFETTPEGVVRDSTDDPGLPAKWTDYLWGGLIVATLGVASINLVNNWQQQNVTGEAPHLPAVKHADNPENLISQAPVSDQSIAVLPFVNMSGSEENEYFSDGISEELLHGLTNLDSSLRVAARTSSFYFKGKDVDIATIGERLNVATVLEGSVRRAGNRVRITAQLINVADGYHLWSETYDRTLDDIFAVQDEIARAIVEALKVELAISPTSTLLVSGTSDLAAYEAYLQGVHQLKDGSPDKALEHFELATQRDPDYADAWGQLAATYMLLSLRHPWEVTAPHGRRAFERALALDPENGYALASKGGYTLRTTWDWASATGHYQRALRSKADHAQMAKSYADVILTPLGQNERARELYSEVLSNDPLNRQAQLSQLLLDTFENNDEAVLDAAQRLERDGEDNSFLYLQRCVSYFMTNDTERLAAFIEQVEAPPFCLAVQAILNGNELVLKTLLASLKLADDREILVMATKKVINTGLGNHEAVVNLWLKDYERNSATLRYVRALNGPAQMEVLMQYPRFQSLLEKLNLDDASLAELERTVQF